MILLNGKGEKVTGDFPLPLLANPKKNPENDNVVILIQLPIEVWKVVYEATENALRTELNNVNLEAMSIWNYKMECELVVEVQEKALTELFLIMHIKISSTIRGEVDELRKLNDYEKFFKDKGNYKDVSSVVNLPKFTVVPTPEEAIQIAAVVKGVS